MVTVMVTVTVTVMDYLLCVWATHLVFQYCFPGIAYFKVCVIDEYVNVLKHYQRALALLIRCCAAYCRALEVVTLQWHVCMSTLLARSFLEFGYVHEYVNVFDFVV
jgi:hypothetical protein